MSAISEELSLVIRFYAVMVVFLGIPLGLLAGWVAFIGVTLILTWSAALVAALIWMSEQ